MIVYLPVAFLKDWLCRYLERRRRSSSSGTNEVVEVGSPLRHKVIEMGLQGTITKKDSEEDFSSHEEDVRPLMMGRGREETHRKEIVTTKQIVLYGLYLAPIWFVTEVCLVFCFFTWCLCS